MNLKELENKHLEILSNFEEEDLKQYIQVLAKNYYLHFLNNEEESFNNTVKQLEEVLKIYKIDYPKLNSYINFCLLESINKLLNETISSGIELEVIDKTEDFFSDYPFKSLADAIEESRKLYFNDVEMEKKIEELERKLAKYEGVNSNGK